MSRIIAGENEPKVPECTISKSTEAPLANIEVSVTDNSKNNVECSFKQNAVNVSQSEQIGQLVSKMLEGTGSGKVTIKIEVVM